MAGYASRWCMRHTGANFFSQFRSKGLMNLFKKLCKQNQECKYTFLRGKLDEFTKDHVRDRLAARAALVAAHAAAVGTRYGVMTTNLAESYNFVLRGNRALPLTALVEGILYGTMNYFKERRELALKHMLENPNTPYCKAIMEYMDVKMEKDMAARPLLDPGIDEKHRASHLESDPQSIDPLQTRTPKKNWMIHPQWEDRLKWAGLLPFARLVEARENVSRLNYDATLITCLVDRWRPETHTFHFRWGEMAPTLEDVSMLLGLPLAGEPIGPLEEPVGWMHSMDARFVGVREGVGPISFEAHGPRQAWLHEFQIEQFGYPDAPMTAAQITRSLEAYLMWLLGKTMFTDNHGNTISARYIPIAQEIAEATEAEDITQRSWGSAVLAATYRGMCKGCQLTSHGSGIVGCPLLLQLWSWTRFPVGRPDIGAGSWPPDELYDADRIDMPTFGSIWTSRKRHFGHNQLRNCYPSIHESAIQ
nr:serine/threonine-protein phosphatase 7 long form homolog [Lolium perenne]